MHSRPWLRGHFDTGDPSPHDAFGPGTADRADDREAGKLPWIAHFLSCSGARGPRTRSGSPLCGTRPGTPRTRRSAPPRSVHPGPGLVRRTRREGRRLRDGCRARRCHRRLRGMARCGDRPAFRGPGQVRKRRRRRPARRRRGRPASRRARRGSAGLPRRELARAPLLRKARMGGPPFGYRGDPVRRVPRRLALREAPRRQGRRTATGKVRPARRQ